MTTHRHRYTAQSIVEYNTPEWKWTTIQDSLFRSRYYGRNKSWFVSVVQQLQWFVEWEKKIGSSHNVRCNTQKKKAVISPHAVIVCYWMIRLRMREIEMHQHCCFISARKKIDKQLISIFVVCNNLSQHPSSLVLFSIDSTRTLSKMFKSALITVVSFLLSFRWRFNFLPFFVRIFWVLMLLLFFTFFIDHTSFVILGYFVSYCLSILNRCSRIQAANSKVVKMTPKPYTPNEKSKQKMQQQWLHEYFITIDCFIRLRFEFSYGSF